MCHGTKHDEGFTEIRENKKEEEYEVFHETWCSVCEDNCKEFVAEAMTANNYLVRSKTLDQWHYFYDHGYIVRYHHKLTGTLEHDFHRYSDELIRMNRKYS